MKDRKGQRKLIVIGLDGVPYAFMRKLLEEGNLPFLQSLTNSGSLALLESTKFPLSAVAWSSSYTGKNPAQIGACGFVRKQRHSYLWEYVDPAERSGQDIWTILSNQGYRSVIIGPLFCKAPKDFEGIFVGGEECGEQDNPYVAVEPDMGTVNQLVASMKQKFDLARRLLKEHAWDWSFIGFLEPDTLHAWYHCSDYAQLVQGYEALDQMLGEFLQGELRDSSVLIYSDHGNRPYEKAFHVNSWLYANGFLQLLPKRERIAHRFTELIQGLNQIKAKSDPLGLKMFYATLFLGRTVVRSLPAIQKLIRKFCPDLQLPQKAKPGTNTDGNIPPPINPGILFDYSRTVAYAALNHGGNLGGIFLNRRGRDPLGIVSDENYRAVRTQIAERLAETKEAETSSSLIKNIWFREQVFHGPFEEDFPDIIFETDDKLFTYISEDDVSRNNVTFDFRNCQHELNGMMLCAGPIFRHQEGLDCNIMDIAPTILSSLGARIPSMDGKVIEEVFDSDHTESSEEEDPLMVLNGLPG